MCGVKKKFNYDGKDFYDAIGNLASRDFNDEEIALHVGEEVRNIIEARNSRLMDKIMEEDVDPNDLPDYKNYSSNDCPMCKKGEKIDALINCHGFSKL